MRPAPAAVGRLHCALSTLAASTLRAMPMASLSGSAELSLPVAGHILALEEVRTVAKPPLGSHKHAFTLLQKSHKTESKLQLDVPSSLPHCENSKDSDGHDGFDMEQLGPLPGKGAPACCQEPHRPLESACGPSPRGQREDALLQELLPTPPLQRSEGATASHQVSSPVHWFRFSRGTHPQDRQNQVKRCIRQPRAGGRKM